MIAWDSFIVDTVLLRRLYVQKTLAIWPRDSGIRTRYPLMAAMPPNLVSRRRARVRPRGSQTDLPGSDFTLSDGGVGPIAVAAVEARQLRFAIGEELFGPDVEPARVARTLAIPAGPGRHLCDGWLRSAIGPP